MCNTGVNNPPQKKSRSAWVYRTKKVTHMCLKVIRTGKNCLVLENQSLV